MVLICRTWQRNKSGYVLYQSRFVCFCGSSNVLYHRPSEEVSLSSLTFCMLVYYQYTNFCIIVVIFFILNLFNVFLFFLLSFQCFLFCFVYIMLNDLVCLTACNTPWCLSEVMLCSQANSLTRRRNGSWRRLSRFTWTTLGTSCSRSNKNWNDSCVLETRLY